MQKRILRIYPGFLLAFATTVLIVAPLGGGDLAALDARAWAKLVLGAVLLQEPAVPGSFAGLREPVLNGALWSIPVEFACYLAVPVMAALGFLGRHRWALAALLGGLLVAIATGMAARVVGTLGLAIPALGISTTTLALNATIWCAALAMFVSGMCMAAFDLRCILHGGVACVVAAAVLACLLSPALALASLSVGFTYLVFWAAFSPVFAWARPLNRKRDISYGVYLYGWPVESLLIWHHRAIGPLAAFAVTMVVVSVLAMASWAWVEAPALRIKPGGHRG